MQHSVHWGFELLVIFRALTLAAIAAGVAASDQKRGRDGQVNVFFWQAPSLLNPYLSAGLKDIEPASVVLEPLAR
ncbi:MAG: hypothetical protein AAF681_13090, partial [Pseudomonadota bacterium]